MRGVGGVQSEDIVGQCRYGVLLVVIRLVTARVETCTTHTPHHERTTARIPAMPRGPPRMVMPVMGMVVVVVLLAASTWCCGGAVWY